MEILWFIPILLVVILVSINNKVKYTVLRNNSIKVSARVVEYRLEKVPIRNDFTRIDYPFVVLLPDRDRLIRKLKYTNSWSKPFEIGEEINVFLYENDLLYWNAYENGLYKFLPNTWDFWSK